MKRREKKVSPKKHGEWLPDFHFQKKRIIDYMSIVK